MTTPTPAETPSVRSRLVRAAQTAGLFIMVAPPLAVVAFMTALAFAKVRTVADLPGLLWIPIGGVLMSPFGYWFAIIPAVIAGVVVGVWQAFLGPLNVWIVAVMGLVGGLGFVYATDGMGTLPHFPDEFETPLALVVGGIVATVASWWIVQQFVRAPLPGGRS